VGELTSAEAGPAELRVRLRMSAAQARASAPENLPSPAPGFQAASCSLFLDPTICFVKHKKQKRTDSVLFNIIQHCI